MSFWDLAHGRCSSLVPPKDLSPYVTKAAGVAGAAIATAGVVLTAIYSPHSLPRALLLGGRLGSQSLKAGGEAAAQRVAENEAKALRRRELGCEYLEIKVRLNSDALHLCHLARARFVTGQLRGAMEAAQKSFDANPNHPESQLLTLFFLLRKKDREVAEQLISHGVLDGGELWLYNAIADHLSNLTSSESLRQILNAAIRTYPRDGATWERLGYFYEGQRDFAAAVFSYEKAQHCLASVNLPWQVALDQGKQTAVEGRWYDAELLYRRAALLSRSGRIC